MIGWTAGQKLYSDSLCVLFMIYGPCSSHELINFIYLLLFFKRKLKQSSAAFRTEFALTFTYLLTGYVCTLHSGLLARGRFSSETNQSWPITEKENRDQVKHDRKIMTCQSRLFLNVFSGGSRPWARRGPGFDLLTLLLSPFCHFFFFYEKLGGGGGPPGPSPRSATGTWNKNQLKLLKLARPKQFHILIVTRNTIIWERQTRILFKRRLKLP